jgi:hypothetical protein
VVQGIEHRFASVHEYVRPKLWAHAIQPQYAELRAWINDQVDGFDRMAVGELLSRLGDPARHTQVVAELATGAAMRTHGYSVQFNPTIDDLTPDLIVTDDEGHRLMAEVWTRGLAEDAVSRNKQWAGLAQRIRKVPAPVALAASAAQPGGAAPPDARMRKRMEAELRRWLIEPRRVGASYRCDDLIFRVVGTTTTGYAELLPIREAAATDRKDVVEAIERKVKKYRRLADRHDMPFIVVLSADDGTGLTADHVDSILEGNNTVTMNIPIDAVGPIDSGPIELRMTDAPPRFDPALSAVAWLDVNNGADAQLVAWDLPTAARTVQTVDAD